MVVPRADPPVGTRGRPFLDFFFSNAVGRSQVPALAVVLEKGRLVPGETFFGVVLFPYDVMKADPMGRKGNGATESLSKWDARLDIPDSFIVTVADALTMMEC